MSNYEDFVWTEADRLARKAECDTPWSYYQQTAVHFGQAGRRGYVTPVAESDGEDRPPLGALHVVTAIQPDEDPGTIESADRMSVLDQALDDASLEYIPAVGASFDGQHSEAGRAVWGLSDDDARRLGLRFGQVAVFAWSGPRWSLLACATDRVTHRGWRWTPDRA